MNEGTVSISGLGEENTDTQRFQKKVLADRSLSRFRSVAEKFADLGIITVPDNYVHGTWLDLFMKKNRGEFYHCDGNISDKNFAGASVQLQAGRRLRVHVFRQTITCMTSEERLEFIWHQNGVLTGAHGASLVWEQKREQLIKGCCYCSFDNKDALWKDIICRRRVPFLIGDSSFSLDTFESDWGRENCFFVFYDEPSDS